MAEREVLERGADGLLAVEPAGQRDYKAVERLYRVCHGTNRLSVTVFDNKIIRLVRSSTPDAMIAPEEARHTPVGKRYGARLWRPWRASLWCFCR